MLELFYMRPATVFFLVTVAPIAGLLQACSCPPTPQLVAGSPSLSSPSYNATGSVEFVGVVESVYPKDMAQYQDLWFRTNHEKLSEDTAPSPAQLQTFVLMFWADLFSTQELKAIKIAKSIEELESSVGSFWLMPRQIRFRIEEPFAGSHAGQFLLYTGLGGGDCGVDFKVGEHWLVSTFLDSAGRWVVHLCSGTAPVKDASAALNKLRNQPR